MKYILKEMRIDHYIKNLVVFIPLLFNNSILTLSFFYKLVFLFFSFCLISSTIYIINDLKDKEKDCLHPYKKFRPIAQNLISWRNASILTISCFLISISISFYLNTFIFIIAYFTLNIIYSFFLRKLPYIDTFCIALGFVIRILSGFYLLNIPIYTTAIFWMFFTSCFFTFLKRKLELKTFKSEQLLHRESLKKLDNKKISFFVLISAFLSVSFFIIMTFKFVNIPSFYAITVFYSILIYRLITLSNMKLNFDDPINFIKKDKFFKILFTIFILCLAYQIF